MTMAVLGMIGAVMCALSPAWGARGYHGLALGLALLGGALALAGGVAALP